jgi:hypothetical protein
MPHDFTVLMAQKPVAELVNIVTASSSDYETPAAEAARAELERRNVIAR